MNVVAGQIGMVCNDRAIDQSDPDLRAAAGQAHQRRQSYEVQRVRRILGG
jgi:hypothetical protein